MPLQLIWDMPERSFLEHYYSQLSGEVARLNRAYLESNLNRGAIAEAEGISLGQLLRSFNETRPQSEPISFEVAGIPFHVRVMSALCDNLTGGIGAGCFGTPVTLRFYLARDFGLPPEMFTLADRHFMGYGLPYKVGWAFGSIVDDILCLSCLQSEIGQRHWLLFERRKMETLLRRGDQVVLAANDDLVTAYGRHLGRLKLVLANHWRVVLVEGCAAVARRSCLGRIAISPRSPETLPFSVRPLYGRALQSIPGQSLVVVTDCTEYRYHMVTTSRLNASSHLFAATNQ